MLLWVSNLIYVHQFCISKVEAKTWLFERTFFEPPQIHRKKKGVYLNYGTAFYFQMFIICNLTHHSNVSGLLTALLNKQKETYIYNQYLLLKICHSNKQQAHSCPVSTAGFGELEEGPLPNILRDSSKIPGVTLLWISTKILTTVKMIKFLVFLSQNSLANVTPSSRWTTPYYKGKAYINNDRGSLSFLAQYQTTNAANIFVCVLSA
jgi:hypothetical protein